MRTLTQTNARARGRASEVFARECARMFLIRMMLGIARAHAALRPRPVQPLMKITPGSFELRAGPGNNKFRQTFIFVHATLCRP